MNPSARVPPTVRLIFACDSVAGDGAGNIVVQNPLTHFQLPAGTTFPFRVGRLSVYLQLTAGLGTFDIAVEVWRRTGDGSRHFVTTSAVLPGLVFSGPTRMTPVARGVELRRVRLRAAGEYELRAVAVTPDGSTPLIGPTASVEVVG